MPSEPTSEPLHPGLPPATLTVVGQAIQDSVVPRLGRAFVPAAVAFAVGAGRAILGALDPTTWSLLVGAPVTAGAMLAYGLRIVQRAFGRPARPWMSLAGVGSLVPPAFGLYLLGWLGLRAVAQGSGAGPLLGGAAMTVLGGWLLRAWLRLVEVQRLAAVMGAPGATE